jgi:hypothetical protein
MAVSATREVRTLMKPTSTLVIVELRCDVCGADALFKPTGWPFGEFVRTPGPGHGSERWALDLCEECCAWMLRVMGVRARAQGRELPSKRNERVRSEDERVRAEQA